jgi:prophage regulatory protein
MSNTRILRGPQAAQYVGLSRSALYRLTKAGRFPAPIKLGLRSSGWLVEELDEFLAKQKAKRDSAQKST